MSRYMSIVYEIPELCFWIHFRNWMRYNLYIFLELREIYVCVMNNCLGKNKIICSLGLTVCVYIQMSMGLRMFYGKKCYSNSEFSSVISGFIK